MLVEVEIDGTELGLFVGRDLLLDLGRSLERLLDRRMQPPGPPTSYQRGTGHLDSLRQPAPREANLEPTPGCAGPDFEQDAACLPLLPLPRIQDRGLVPGARWNRRALRPFLAFCLSFFPIHAPLGEVGVKRACRT